MKRAQVLQLLGLKDGDTLQQAALDAARTIREVITGGCGQEVAKEVEIPEEEFLEEYRKIMMLLFGIADEQACRRCGCTYNEPCDDGCAWVEADLCSSCVETCSARARWGKRELACVKKPNHKPPHESIGGHRWKDSDPRAVVPYRLTANGRKAARRA